MPRTTSRANQSTQITATAAAKRAKVEEAGLRGPRLGEISSAKRRAQARRDARADAAIAQTRTAKPGVDPKASLKVAAKKPVVNAKSPRGRTSTLIEVRTANSVKGSSRLDAFAEKIVTDALSRFMPRITRIDVHLSDANAEKNGDNDKRCQIEVRPASQQPVSATAMAGTIEKALSTASSKMKRLLAKRLDPRVRS